MAARKPFLLRLPPELYAELQRWAADELRSVNGQIEFLLRRALRQRGSSAGEEPPEDTSDERGAQDAPGTADPA